MKLKNAAIAATVLVIIVGFAMISPLYFRGDKVDRRLVLCFSVNESEGAEEWCRNLAAILDSYNLPATVFIVGNIAQQYPEAVTCFSSKVDVGSKTYSNLNLSGIVDYTLKLQEVQNGKSAVDQAGNLNSKVFCAPVSATDQDIYSLLNRSGILVDFSYNDHYNVYENNQFVRYDVSVFSGESFGLDFFLDRAKTAQLPAIIQFNNTCSASTIDAYLSRLVLGDFVFVNASQLTGLSLTERGA